jgi:cardiolipin synthase A/B
VKKNDRKESKIRRFALDLSSCAVLLLVATLISSCGSVTDASALLHENPLYAVSPHIIGPEGPLTPAQAEHLIEQRAAHQQVPTDILGRDVAFEQVISNVPLVAGNKVTLLKNGAATYAAMLALNPRCH